MQIEKTIVELGTAAILRYGEIARSRHDNEVPRSFLRSFVAERLHDRFRRQIYVERVYAAIALDLGMPVTADLLTALGGVKADVTIYDDGRPSAIIGLDVLDAASPFYSTGPEIDKARLLARFAELPVFLGMMICPITVSLEARIERLHDAYNGNMYVGERQPSRNGQWEWCFACVSI